MSENKKALDLLRLATKEDNKNIAIKEAEKEIGKELTEAEKIAKEVEVEAGIDEATRKYLEKMSVDVEVVTSGVTNKVALMISGSIPSNHRDLAAAWTVVKNAVHQLKAIQDKLKEAIISDPMVPSAFIVDDISYEYTTTKVRQLDTAAWKKLDPAGYNSVKSIYGKEVERTAFKAVNVKGRRGGK